MTVNYKNGDVFTSEQPAVIHGVNTMGVMGAGIAKTVRRAYPDVYGGYRDACHEGKLKPGAALPIFGVSMLEAYPDRWIINAASQDKTGPSATYAWLRSSLEESFSWAEKLKLAGVALPWIGAGIGGLEQSEVKKIIEELSEVHPELTIEVWTY